MKYFIINSSIAPIYSAPNFQSELITQAILGESCIVLKTYDDWFFIQQWDKYEGWIHSFYGQKSNNLYETSHIFYNIHGYSKNNIEKRNIYYGTKLKKYNSNTLIFPDGWMGSIPEGFQKKMVLPTRENILKIGNQFLGIPYLWGGKSSLGIDCSGLIQTVFGSVGIFLPRDASEQAEYFIDRKNTLKNIEIGDLLFFGKKSKILHVAICAGKNNILHSQGWVKKESLNKYKSHFNKRLYSLFQFSASIEDILNL